MGIIAVILLFVILFITMGLLRRRLNRRLSSSGNNNEIGGQAIAYYRFAKLAFILSAYLVYASYCAVSAKPKWKLRVRNVKATIEQRFSLLRRGRLYEFLFSSPSSLSSSSDTAGAAKTNARPRPIRRHYRIPCGLIVKTDDGNEEEETREEDVLPLSTCIDFDNGDGISTLNARALERHPQLQRHVLKKASKTYPLDVIPAVIFRLRMGSVEATVERSPELHIAGGGKGGDDDACDLTLGAQFWDNHSVEFGEDELYLSTKSKTNDGGNGPRGGDRVMVPYLLIRSSPLGEEEL